MKNTSQNSPLAQVIEFPVAKALDHAIDMDEFAFEQLADLEIENFSKNTEITPEKEEVEINKFLEQSLEDLKIPPYVLKMRKINSVSTQIDLIKRISKKIEYYINEIEAYKK